MRGGGEQEEEESQWRDFGSERDCARFRVGHPNRAPTCGPRARLAQLARLLPLANGARRATGKRFGCAEVRGQIASRSGFELFCVARCVRKRRPLSP